MHKFEYWAHRLVPHMAFDDFIEKAENLGGKKPVKVCPSLTNLFSLNHILFIFFKNALQHLRDKLNIQASSNDDEQISHTLVIRNFIKQRQILLFYFSLIYYQQLTLKILKVLQMTFQMRMN
jgi:hypothetical protein